jgi:hypothetical protein
MALTLPSTLITERKGGEDSSGDRGYTDLGMLASLTRSHQISDVSLRRIELSLEMFPVIRSIPNI